MFFIYGGAKELVVKCYTNASFIASLDDFQSQTGYMLTLNGGH
jgi:hypothetical protein